ncbi:hypothetical protein [Devosia rhizoryzae]|uniref:Uncharacterized protein n=1 Tax=Devosia rhizoryzae TaxID=2774137 RepID=A0ABX7C8G6_9HYPH|nr:hypothetical protein [Devosia rhizoryzae]QQR39569.1 hypothetical protein JI748_00680 [Devosia rhizoryzae]
MSRTSPAAITTYALAGLLAITELVVLWDAIHPNVSDDFRAYYIDHTTTCLPQPVTGNYTIGTELNFRSGGPDTRELRPCGWEGPAGDGMHSIGQSSRLRFAISEPQDLTLMLELTGVTLPGPPAQRVHVSANGTALGEIEVPSGETERFTFDVPAALASARFIDILLDFPDAISPRTGVSNTQWRSVKLTAASLVPQDPSAPALPPLEGEGSEARPAGT